jgi:hypothetical protein
VKAKHKENLSRKENVYDSCRIFIMVLELKKGAILQYFFIKSNHFLINFTIIIAFIIALILFNYSSRLEIITEK